MLVIKKALANGHYELKEYTIDALEGEGEQSTMLDRKAHPIYPSKAGLKPSLLGLSISRALKILNPDVDPIPPDVLIEFNLLNLFDAYMGIHKPKDRSEADLARRRLIFDDFFYLQFHRVLLPSSDGFYSAFVITPAVIGQQSLLMLYILLWPPGPIFCFFTR